MDRMQQVEWIRQLANSIADNGGISLDAQAVHDEIQAQGTSSRYLRRGLDQATGEYDVSECLAHDLVDYALSDEGRDAWDIEIPEWFDDHDRRLLVEHTANALS